MACNIDFLVDGELELIQQGYEKVYDYYDDVVNSQSIHRIHEVSLNKESLMGLSPEVGLFGTDKWIENIHNGIIKHEWDRGEIVGKGLVGMDEDEAIRINYQSGRTELLGLNSFNLIPKNSVGYFDTGNKIVCLYLYLPLKDKESVTELKPKLIGIHRSMMKTYMLKSSVHKMRS